MNRQQLEDILKDTQHEEELRYLRGLNENESTELIEEIELAIEGRKTLIIEASKYLAKVLDKAQDESGFDQATFYLGLARLMLSVAHNREEFGLPSTLVKNGVDSTVETLKAGVFLVEILKVFKEGDSDGAVN